MVGLACDLMLDSMECCADGSKWAWFHQYCMAARMARALQRRTPLPQEYVHTYVDQLASGILECGLPEIRPLFALFCPNACIISPLKSGHLNQDTFQSGHLSIRTPFNQDTSQSGHLSIRTPQSGHLSIRTPFNQDTLLGPKSVHILGTTVIIHFFTLRLFCLPTVYRCLGEVNEKIDSLKLPDEPKELAVLHEDHKLFQEEHDEQLLLWTQRSEFNTNPVK